MSPSPEISVVMSVYNAELYLSQAIDSILGQSFKDFEFIIIEDCSTDQSLKILEHYAQQDQRIKLIRKPENRRMKGFIENLNIGISQAKGRYIARMDADDIAYPDRFEKQFQFLEQHPEVFMIGSSINLIDEDNQLLRKLPALENNTEIQQQMTKKVAMYHPVIMFRNEGVRYRENIYYCEDYDLYLRLMNQGKKFHNFTEVLLDYRILNSSISRKDGNFMRSLFVEKVKQFYTEEKKKGQDFYALFSPDNLLDLLNTEKVSTQSDLDFALGVAVKFGYKKEFNQMLLKYKSLGYLSIRVKLLGVMIKLPGIISKIYFKIFS